MLIQKLSISKISNNNNTNDDKETNNNNNNKRSKSKSTSISTIKTNYGTKEYWHKFYSSSNVKLDKSTYFEWFCTFNDIQYYLRRIFKDVFKNDSKTPVLEIGCGISSLVSNLVLDLGCENITCIDFHDEAFDIVKKLHEKTYGHAYFVLWSK